MANLGAGPERRPVRLAGPQQARVELGAFRREDLVGARIAVQEGEHVARVDPHLGRGDAASVEHGYWYVVSLRPERRAGGGEGYAEDRNRGKSFHRASP